MKSKILLVILKRGENIQILSYFGVTAIEILILRVQLRGLISLPCSHQLPLSEHFSWDSGKNGKKDGHLKLLLRIPWQRNSLPKIPEIFNEAIINLFDMSHGYFQVLNTFYLLKEQALLTNAFWCYVYILMHKNINSIC